MFNINDLQLPKTITNSYDVEHNTFITKEKEFETEIGDIKQDEFLPQIKIKRWDNECNFSVRYIDNEIGKLIIETDKNKIKYIKNKTECHFYDKGFKEDTGGYEFEIILKEKPKSNIIRFSIETKGLDFFYQPELTQVEKDKGANMPDNIIGSYAVYHNSKKNDYSQIGGKNYKTGKAFHIYRPEIIDKTGKKVWGKLNIDEAKSILTIEIPQEFLDTAIYPVIVDPTFGYTTKGSTSFSMSAYWLSTTWYNGETGIVQSITSYFRQYGSNIPDLRNALYKKTGSNTGDLISGSETNIWTLTSGWDGWKTLNCGTPPSVLSSDNYWIPIYNSAGVTIYYDSGAFGRYGYQSQYTTTFPATITLNAGQTKILSVYATYSIPSPAGSPNFTSKKNYNGYLSFVQQFIKHRLNDTTPWANPDGDLIS